MIRPGLVSVTLRQLAATAVIDHARACQLEGIEWGGDLHVPPGQPALAREVGARTRDAGLAVVCYGSYYRAGGAATGETVPFDAVLETAVALGAPVIRVWAGNVASENSSAASRAAVIADLARITALAAGAGLQVATEFHDGTLCDRVEGVQAVQAAVARPELLTLWQPRHGIAPAQNLTELCLLLPALAHVHVFHWWPTWQERHPLVVGRERWTQFLAAIVMADRTRMAAEAGTKQRDRWALLEFVRDDEPSALRRDAAALREIIAVARA